MDVGGEIRRRRTRQGLTLDGLAGRSGVSRAMLSEIERGTKNPTIKVVCQIAAGLDCTVSALLGEDANPPTGVTVVRHDQRRVLIDTQSGVERHLLSPAFQPRGIEVLWYVIPVGQGTGTLPHRANVAEHITVIEGRLRCNLGERQVTLEAGDSLAFPADRPHGFENIGAGPCRYFLIIDASTLK